MRDTDNTLSPLSVYIKLSASVRDHAQLLHMHAVGVCDSNFLCSLCVCVCVVFCFFFRQEISFVRTDVNDEPDLASSCLMACYEICSCASHNRGGWGGVRSSERQLWLACLICVHTSLFKNVRVCVCVGEECVCRSI